ncbi:hypothetical protein ACA910_007786 [Epithemia clementina (nom. ined.)]
MRQGLLLALLWQLSACFHPAAAFTSSSSPGVFVRKSRYGAPQQVLPNNIRPWVVGRSKVDAMMETKSDDRVLSESSGEGKGLKPPFTVTIEGDNQTYGQAVERTLAWVGAASVFGGGLWVLYGSEVGQEFFAGYLVEQSLSVDNLFVFLLLFEYFRVPQKLQDRVLNWGIFGAIVMRAVMIGIGAAALANFHEVLLVFASILLFSSIAFFVGAKEGGDDGDQEDFGENAIVRFSQSLLRSTDKFDGDRFFTVIDGVTKATPLLICTIAVEISDVVFAVDSIPAVFGVTENPMIVFSSNMFAIMGLRSMYTILSKAASELKYLEPAVALVLGFIGSKMVAEYFGYRVPTEIALVVVASMLTTGIVASLLDKTEDTESAEGPSSNGVNGSS